MGVSVEHRLREQFEALLAGDHGLLQDPYPLYARLREEAPVLRLGNVTVLSSHADVEAAFHAPTRFPQPGDRVMKLEGRFSLLSEEEIALFEEIIAFERLFISRQNGDEHRRYRTAAQRAFTPKRLEELVPQIGGIVDELLETLVGADVADWMALARRVPLLVIMDLLGASREDADRVKRFGDDELAALMRLPLEPEAIRTGHRRLGEYREYAGELIERNRRERSRTGLVALLLDAEEDDRLRHDELVATFMHLLFAGHETTTNLIGNGLLAILTTPGQWQLLCSRPELVPRAVEEMLRFDSPVQMTGRTAAPDVAVRGVAIPDGTSVILMEGSANRDPEVFEEPDRFDVTRSPNAYLSLGRGRHFCLGGPLARLEGQIVFSTLIRRFPDVALAVDPDQVEWHTSPRLRGLVSLPVTLGEDRARDASEH